MGKCWIGIHSLLPQWGFLSQQRGQKSQTSLSLGASYSFLIFSWVLSQSFFSEAVEKTWLHFISAFTPAHTVFSPSLQVYLWPNSFRHLPELVTLGDGLDINHLVNQELCLFPLVSPLNKTDIIALDVIQSVCQSSTLLWNSRTSGSSSFSSQRDFQALMESNCLAAVLKPFYYSNKQDNMICKEQNCWGVLTRLETLHLLAACGEGAFKGKREWQNPASFRYKFD